MQIVLPVVIGAVAALLVVGRGGGFVQCTPNSGNEAPMNPIVVAIAGGLLGLLFAVGFAAL